MPSVSIPAIISAGATIGGSLIQGNAASSAAKDQEAAAEAGQQTQLAMFNTVQQNLAPYNSTGQSALSQLASLFGLNGANGGQPNAAAATSQLANFPGYQFGLNQGTQALDRSAASRGLDLSGAQLKDAQAYGQGYAQQQAWAPYVSQLNSIAGLGENAGAGVGTAAVSTGQGIAASQLAAGQASAAGTVSTGNILSSGLNGLSSQLSPFISSYGNSAFTLPTGSPASYAQANADANSPLGL